MRIMQLICNIFKSLLFLYEKRWSSKGRREEKQSLPCKGIMLKIMSPMIHKQQFIFQYAKDHQMCVSAASKRLHVFRVISCLDNHFLLECDFTVNCVNKGIKSKH